MLEISKDERQWVVNEGGRGIARGVGLLEGCDGYRGETSAGKKDRVRIWNPKDLPFQIPNSNSQRRRVMAAPSAESATSKPVDGSGIGSKVTPRLNPEVWRIGG